MADLAQVLRRLEDPDWSVRVDAVRDVASFDETIALPALRRALYDPSDTAVTQAAMKALLSFRTDGARAILLEALQSDDDETANHLDYFLRVHRSEEADTVLRLDDETA